MFLVSSEPYTKGGKKKKNSNKDLTCAHGWHSKVDGKKKSHISTSVFYEIKENTTMSDNKNIRVKIHLEDRLRFHYDLETTSDKKYVEKSMP